MKWFCKGTLICACCWSLPQQLSILLHYWPLSPICAAGEVLAACLWGCVSAADCPWNQLSNSFSASLRSACPCPRRMLQALSTDWGPHFCLSPQQLCVGGGIASTGIGEADPLGQPLPYLLAPLMPHQTLFCVLPAPGQSQESPWCRKSPLHPKIPCSLQNTPAPELLPSGSLGKEYIFMHVWLKEPSLVHPYERTELKIWRSTLLECLWKGWRLAVHSSCVSLIVLLVFSMNSLPCCALQTWDL